MANVISDETIEYVGILAKLELSEDEKEQAKKDMGSMLDYIDKLNELDTSGGADVPCISSTQCVPGRCGCQWRCPRKNAGQCTGEKRWQLCCAENGRVGGKPWI